MIKAITTLLALVKIPHKCLQIIFVHVYLIMLLKVFFFRINWE